MTRTRILDAAERRDYDALRPLIKTGLFRADNPDPVTGWRRDGPKPLRTMGVLLEMRHAVRQTNEGTLYQWPRFDANSHAEDLTADERDQLRKVLTETELRNALLPEYGYTGPRLGILEDGSWWFFHAGGAP